MLIIMHLLLGYSLSLIWLWLLHLHKSFLIKVYLGWVDLLLAYLIFNDFYIFWVWFWVTIVEIFSSELLLCKLLLLWSILFLLFLLESFWLILHQAVSIFHIGRGLQVFIPIRLTSKLILVSQTFILIFVTILIKVVWELLIMRALIVLNALVVLLLRLILSTTVINLTILILISL